MTTSLELPGNLGDQWGNLLNKGAIVRLAQEVYDEKLDKSLNKEELLRVAIALEMEKGSSEGICDMFSTLPEDQDDWDALLSKSAIVKIAEDAFHKKWNIQEKKDIMLAQLKAVAGSRSSKTEADAKSTYVTRDDFNDLKKKLDSMESKLEELISLMKGVKATDGATSDGMTVSHVPIEQSTGETPLRASRPVWPASMSEEETSVLAKMPCLGDDTQMTWTTRQLSLLATAGHFKPAAFDLQRGSRFLSEYGTLQAIQVERPSEEVITGSEGIKKIAEKLVNFTTKCQEAGLDYSDYGQALCSHVNVTTYTNFKPETSLGKADRFYELVAFLLRDTDLHALKMSEYDAVCNLSAKCGRYLRSELLRMLNEIEDYVFPASRDIGVSKLTDVWRFFNHAGYLVAMSSGADLSDLRLLREMLMQCADPSVKLVSNKNTRDDHAGAVVAVIEPKLSTVECLIRKDEECRYWRSDCLCARCDGASGGFADNNHEKSTQTKVQLHSMLSAWVPSLDMGSCTDSSSRPQEMMRIRLNKVYDIQAATGDTYNFRFLEESIVVLKTLLSIYNPS